MNHFLPLWSPWSSFIYLIRPPYPTLRYFKCVHSSMRKFHSFYFKVWSFSFSFSLKACRWSLKGCLHHRPQSCPMSNDIFPWSNLWKMKHLQLMGPLLGVHWRCTNSSDHALKLDVLIYFIFEYAQKWKFSNCFMFYILSFFLASSLLTTLTFGR